MRGIIAIASVLLLTSCAAPAQTQAPLFRTAAFSPLTVGKGSGKVMLADVNRANHVDIVTQHLLSESVNVMLGDGQGKFVAAAGSPIKLAYQPGSMDTRPAPAGIVIETIADANADGRLDAVISYGDRNSIAVLLNDGNGLFAASPSTSLALSGQTYAIVAADVNGDRKDDLVAATVRSRATPFNSHVTVFLAGADGFVPVPGSPFPAGFGGYNLAVADLNADGRPDVVTSSFESTAVTILLGTSAGTSNRM